MPNTLVHLGVQGFASRLVSPVVDLRLVYLSCVLPDLPWIIQRAVRIAAPAVDRIELMAWSGVQGSLIFCLILCAAIGVVSLHPQRTFAVLASGSLFHLFLDIVQIKWGRGAIFFAPFDWQPSSFDLLWPEHPVFPILLAASVVFVAATWRGIGHARLFRRPTPARYFAAALLAACWAVGPALFTSTFIDNDIYFTATLADVDTRAGKRARFDRAPILTASHAQPAMQIYTGERIRLRGVAGTPSGLISARGRFIARDTFEVQQYHLHPAYARVSASLVGLLLVALLWGRTLYAWWSRRAASQGSMAQRNR